MKFNFEDFSISMALCMLSCFSSGQLSATLWTPPGSSVHGILQARIMNRLPFLPPGHLLDAGIKPASLTSLILTGGFFTTSTT